MSTVPDNLQTLLSEIHKTISDNRSFLKALKEDAGSEQYGEEEEGNVTEDFEEL